MSQIQRFLRNQRWSKWGCKIAKFDFTQNMSGNKILKFQNYCATQILREITFWDSRSSKNFLLYTSSEPVEFLRLGSSRPSRYKSTRLESKFDLKSTSQKIAWLH